MSYTVINTQPTLIKKARELMENNNCMIKDIVLQPLSESQICEAVKDVDAVIAGGEKWTESVFQAASKLKIVARFGAGYDAVNLQAASKKKVWVTITPGATANAVADFTLGMILNIMRNIPQMVQDLKNGKWQQFGGRELGSLTVGVIGTGFIGKGVIERIKGFGSKILAYDVNPDAEFARKTRIKYVSLDELLSESDLVTINCSLNDSTRGLINESKLNLMKKDAYLINSARALIVDKQAIIKKLQKREIAGYAVDVFENVPCGPDEPLLKFDNVIATPWAAYKTDGSVEKMSMMSAQEVVSILTGKKPIHPINKI